jgi:hypothetical protein
MRLPGGLPLKASQRLMILPYDPANRPPALHGKQLLHSPHRLYSLGLLVLSRHTGRE